MRGWLPQAIRVGAGGLLGVLVLMSATLAAAAQRIPDDLAARLNERQLKAYQAYLAARTPFERRLDMYWAEVDSLRDGRRRKRAAGVPFSAADYVPEHPPQYEGPPLPSDVAKIIADLRPPRPDKEIAGLHDFLAAAKSHYGYVPSAIAEREFKRRYAIEALRVGLSKAQVLDVFALETGGRGVYDMQAGIDPETRKGRPISTALGYAQLLAGNSVNEVAKSGHVFVRRLEDMARAPGVSPPRAAYLKRKAAIVRKMVRAAKSVPYQWSRHVALGNTPRGQGIHALNLDPDVGPWLQVIKLRGVLDHGLRAGRTSLSGPELELMNLAGPGTGLEMMTPIGRQMPTTNFFSRPAYYRNTIVREKSGAELLAALEQRMRVNEKKAGAVEFARIFDEIAGSRR
ncbi:MAG TPA: hypothetical protein VNZ50_00285 [Hyphomicrobiaceae bacterium]|nr:hypothetical protein [Hyphomicrobiaceae bacterium]